MEDVVALIARTGELDSSYAYLTWGRLYGAVDGSRLVDVVRHAVIRRFKFPTDVQIVLCESLAEVSHYTRFYEGLLQFAMMPIPFGDGYDDWAAEKRAALKRGEDIYALGPPRSHSAA